jgi:hypothetical protein
MIYDFLSKINVHKELIIAIIGWFLAILQFLINKKNKKIDRKFEAYSGYMTKADKIMHNISNDPKYLLDFNIDFFKKIINNSGDEKVINESLIKYNEKIKDFVLNATEPLMILRQELNQLKLICSKELLIKINEMNNLTLDYNNAVQNSLSVCLPNNINSTVSQLQVLTQNDRWRSFEILNNDILNIMRKEIGS